MPNMRAFRQIATLVISASLLSTAVAGLNATRQDTQINVAGDHFRIMVDAAAGGEMVEIEMFDGSGWNRVLGADGQTCPMIKISDGDAEYLLAHDNHAEIENLEVTPELVRFQTVATPKTADGKALPWTVKLGYQIYAEGGAFVDIDYHLHEGQSTLTSSSISFVVDRALTEGAKFRQDRTPKGLPTAFPVVRVVFGANPARSFTNEMGTVVEYCKPMAGAVAYRQETGRFTWSLANGHTHLKAPYRYHNRFALALGSAPTGKPKTNCIAQRVYHWINVPGLKGNYFPTNEHVDKIAANGATMLVFHLWIANTLHANGHPHADYTKVINDDEEGMARAIDYAHRKGMRVGLYMRGIERYALRAKFFEKRCRRNWDGLFLDWQGPAATANHERRWGSEPDLGDKHFSADGSHVPALEYFQFTKRLREIVGPGGFLIGHRGSVDRSLLGYLCFDASLSGEASDHHNLFDSRDETVFRGMMCGSVFMPWTADAKKYLLPASIAKMAAWGIYPHVALGADSNPALSSTNPDDPAHAYALSYWRVLRAVDAERATVYNLPSSNRIAARSSNTDFHSVVYREAGEADTPDNYLVIAANLSDTAEQSTLTLVPEVLGMSGDYRIHRVDSKTGKLTSRGTTSGVITTSRLSAHGIEGFRLSKVK